LLDRSPAVNASKKNWMNIVIAKKRSDLYLLL